MGKLINALMPKLWPWLALAGTGLGRAGVTAAPARGGPTGGLGTAGRIPCKSSPSTGAACASSCRNQSRRTADAARITSLQHHLRTTATAHAQAASDAAACRSLGDRHQELAALAAEGAQLVGEGVGLVQQRDAAVALLKNQVVMERQVVDKLLHE